MTAPQLQKSPSGLGGKKSPTRRKSVGETNKSSGISPAYLRQIAEAKVKEKSAKTHVFRLDLEERYPRFNMRELSYGRVLGQGGFCIVREVKKIDLQPDHFRESCPTDRYDLEQKDRKFMKDRCIRHGDARYAVKQLHVSPHDEGDGASRYCEGLVDLAMEVKFLAILQHSHIIKLRAISDKSSCSGGYFVLLDRLYDTLESRINKWKRQEARHTGALSKFRIKSKRRTPEDLICDRLVVAYDLATALLHMHSHRVTYRDLKPENIGFDVRNDVKIFDLGLAKEMLPEEIRQDGTYDMTPMTGSLRYMAPENGRGLPYNESVDVYSFGILLHQIMSTEVPFRNYSVNMLKAQVFEKGVRPIINAGKLWPDRTVLLIRDAWCQDWTKRPKMADIVDEIRQTITMLQGPDTLVLDQTNRTNKSAADWDYSSRGK